MTGASAHYFGQWYSPDVHVRHRIHETGEQRGSVGREQELVKSGSESNGWSRSPTVLLVPARYDTEFLEIVAVLPTSAG